MLVKWPNSQVVLFISKQSLGQKVQSKVKSNLKSKFTVCVGTFKYVVKKQQVRDFFTIFGYNKDKNITLFDTNWFQNVAVVVDIVFDIVVLVALAVVVGVRFAVLLQLQQLLQFGTGSQQFTILKSISVKYVVFLSSLYTNIKKKSCIYYFLASPFKV